MTGIKRNLKQTLEIAETAADPRIKLQARSIANECYHSIIDLTTNAGVISESLKYVEKRRERIDYLAAKAAETEKKDAEAADSGGFLGTEQR